MSKVTFADGSALEGVGMDLGEGVLVCLSPYDLAASFAVFSNRAKTAHMVYELGDIVRTFDGYTEIAFILTEHKVSIGLRRPE